MFSFSPLGTDMLDEPTVVTEHLPDGEIYLLSDDENTFENKRRPYDDIVGRDIRENKRMKYTM